MTGFVGTKKDLESTNSVQSAQQRLKKMHSAAAHQVSLSYDYGAFNRRHIVIWTKLVAPAKKEVSPTISFTDPLSSLLN